MTLRIGSNIEAFNAHRRLSATQSAVAKSMERLSSGSGINRAADDAAGLSISERLRAQSRGLAQAMRNAHDGVSLVQTAEGALSEVHSMLQRVRELAVQFHTGTISTRDRQAIQSEAEQLRQEVARIGRTSSFNGIPILDRIAQVPMQVGAGDGETIEVPTTSLRRMLSVPHRTNFDAADYTPVAHDTTFAITTRDRSADAHTWVESHTTITIPGGTSGDDAEALFNATVTLPVYAAGRLDAHYDQYAFAFYSDHEGEDFETRVTGPTLTPWPDSYERLYGARDRWPAFELGQANDVAQIDEAINAISTQRAAFGAVQNRLQHTLNNLVTYQENLLASESRIRDVDMAKEMVTLSKDQILSQAGTSMLAQASRGSQGVLTLLR